MAHSPSPPTARSLLSRPGAPRSPLPPAQALPIPAAEAPGAGGLAPRPPAQAQDTPDSSQPRAHWPRPAHQPLGRSQNRGPVCLHPPGLWARTHTEKTHHGHTAVSVTKEACSVDPFVETACSPAGRSCERRRWFEPECAAPHLWSGSPVVGGVQIPGIRGQITADCEQSQSDSRDSSDNLRAPAIGAVHANYYTDIQR